MGIAGAVLIPVGVGALTAVWGIVSQRTIARRRATFDYIASGERDREVIEARRKFIELTKAPGGLAPWAAEDKEKTPEAQSVRIVLNEFELIAIGIQRGIVDAELYRRWYESGVIRHWNHAEPFVKALRARTGNQAVFHEFEELAKWFRGEKNPRRRWWVGRFF